MIFYQVARKKIIDFSLLEETVPLRHFHICMFQLAKLRLLLFNFMCLGIRSNFERCQAFIK